MAISEDLQFKNNPSLSSSIELESSQDAQFRKKIHKISDETLDQLEKSYHLNKYPTKEEKNTICSVLNLNISQIDNWYKRRRQADAQKGQLDLPRKKYFDPEIKKKLSKIYNQHKEKIGDLNRCKFNKKEIIELAKELKLSSKQIRSWFSGQRRKQISFLRRMNKSATLKTAYKRSSELQFSEESEQQKVHQQRSLPEENAIKDIHIPKSQSLCSLTNDSLISSEQNSNHVEEEEKKAKPQSQSNQSKNNEVTTQQNVQNCTPLIFNLNLQQNQQQIFNNNLNIQNQSQISAQEVQKLIQCQEQNQHTQQQIYNYLLQQQLTQQNFNNILCQQTLEQQMLQKLQNQQLQNQNCCTNNYQYQKLDNNNALGSPLLNLQLLQLQEQQKLQQHQQQQLFQNQQLQQQLKQQTNSMLCAESQKFQYLKNFNDLLAQNESQFQQSLLNFQQQQQFSPVQIQPTMPFVHQNINQNLTQPQNANLNNLYQYLNQNNQILEVLKKQNFESQNNFYTNMK